MKIKLFKKKIQDNESDSELTGNSQLKANGPWWVIFLKVLAYIIGLVLGGAATTSCASHML